MRKAALEEAIAFGNKSCTFAFEDTVDRCYRDVVDVLQAHAWRRVPYRKRSKVERKKLPNKDMPKLIWTLNDKDVEFSDLLPEQLCNHFEGIHHLTTKQGFCELIHDSALIGEDGLFISPRAYNLGDPIHRDEFIDDFRLTAAANVLVCYLADRHAAILNDRPRLQPFSTLSSSTKAVVGMCVWAVTWHLRIHVYGEWPGVDNSKHFKDRDQSLNDSDWYDVCALSYDLSKLDCGGSSGSGTGLRRLLGLVPAMAATRRRLFAAYAPLDHKICALLRLYLRIQPQATTEGHRNIWVVKSPDSSCGKGIKLLSRLDEILDLERRMKGRTVQKYIESPLLDSAISAGSAGGGVKRAGAVLGPGVGGAVQGGGVKFDLRVWVLVTSVQPLQACVYRRIYGRRCCEAYRTDVLALDPSRHLTNYSIQKKLQRRPQRPGDAAEDDDDESGPPATATVGGDLLFLHQDVEVAVQRAFLDMQAQGTLPPALAHAAAVIGSIGVPTGGARPFHAWKDFVWPAVCRKISAVLRMAEQRLAPRTRSFEFLGFDVLLDGELSAYVLEVNMSPAMAHRGADQSLAIQQMAVGLVRRAVEPNLDAATRAMWLQTAGEGAEMAEGSLATHSSCPSRSPCASSNPDPTASPRAMGEDLWEDLPCAPPPLHCASGTEDAGGPLRTRARITGNGMPRPASSSGARPKSAMRSMRPSPATSQAPLLPPSSQLLQLPQGEGLDIGFVLQGRAICDRSIALQDQLCTGFMRLVSLQRWFRRGVARLRSYYQRRHRAALLLQTHSRGWQARRLRQRLVQQRACVAIQCAVRGLLARRHRSALARYRAATLLQTQWRRCLAVAARAVCFRARAGERIGRWLLWRRRKRIGLHLRRVLRVCGWYKRWRVALARRLMHLLRWHQLRRRRRATVIQRAVRQWRVRRRLRLALRREQLRRWGEEVAQAARRRGETRLFAVEDALAAHARASCAAGEALAALLCMVEAAGAPVLDGFPEDDIAVLPPPLSEGLREEEDDLLGLRAVEEGLLDESAGVEVLTIEEFLARPLVLPATQTLPSEVPPLGDRGELLDAQVEELARHQSQRLLAKHRRPATTPALAPALPPMEEGFDYDLGPSSPEPVPVQRGVYRHRPYLPEGLPGAERDGLEDFFAQTFLRAPDFLTTTRIRPGAAPASTPIAVPAVALTPVSTPVVGAVRVRRRVGGGGAAQATSSRPKSASHARPALQQPPTLPSSNHGTRSSSRSAGPTRPQSAQRTHHRRAHSPRRPLPEAVRELYQLYI